MSDKPKVREVPVTVLKEIFVEANVRNFECENSVTVEEIDLDHDQVSWLTGEEPGGGWRVFVVHYL